MSGGEKRAAVAWLGIFLGVLVWSGIRPHDYFTWFLEVSPAVLGVFVLGMMYGRFRFTSLAYCLMLILAVILMVGGRYTYAEVPLFNWLRDTLDLGRNHYDKVGHFAQGFVPAVITREILIRTSPLKPGKWLFFIVVSICLAVSAGYELLEWWVAVAVGSGADDFLGTQGYVWDTQSDMALAMIGAICALAALGKWHDRQLGVLREDTRG